MLRPAILSPLTEVFMNDFTSIKAEIDRLNVDRNRELDARSKHDKAQRLLKAEIDRQTKKLLEVMTAEHFVAELPTRKK